MIALRFLPLASCLVFLLPTEAIAAGTNARETARRYELEYARARTAATSATNAARIPSFARQTGLPCNVCHTTFPQLTAFGRRFKLAGYTLTTEQTINSGGGDSPRLRLPRLPPPSAMVEASVTSLKTKVPGTQNTDVAFPDQLSVFLGGAVTPSLGAFVQLTYDGTEGAIGIDNVDIRYARQGNLGSRSLLYGLTLNNNPTVQDVWNTTSAWGFPYASSAVAPTPAAGTLIDGGLSQASAGLGAYALWADLLYTEFSVYRSAPQGGPNPPDATSEGTLNGVAPYWRVALQHNLGKLYAMVGTYGLRASLWPSGVQGLRDKYTDLGFDGQLEMGAGPGTMVGHATYIHEKQTLDATFDAGGSSNAANTLRTFRADGSYLLNAGLGLTLGYFQTSGDADATLYAPDPVVGSAAGMPDSRGWISQLQYSPWLNTHVNLQYVLYNKFNGAGTNYDGSGRSASDNNTLYLLFWLAF
jgi:hypothetical protein